MNVTIKDNECENNSKYPVLMRSINNGEIVIFTKEKTGTSLGSDIHEVGYFSNKWAMSSFIPFKGTVELSNESK